MNERKHSISEHSRLEGFLSNQISELLAFDYVPTTMPGMAASLQLNGDVLFEHYCGLASLEHSVPISSSTRFHVASLSKEITATLLTILESDGLVNVLTPAYRYLPLYPLDKEIRVIDLLKHTSGLRDQWELLDWAGWRGSDLITSADVAAIIKSNSARPPAIEPYFRYCNTGYFLLAEIIESVSKEKLSELAQSDLFGPLLMTATAFRSDAKKPLIDFAASYSLEQNTVIVSSPNLAVPGPTSLVTSLPDFIKWESELSRPHVLSSDLVTRLADNEKQTLGLSVPYGRGFMLTEMSFGHVMFHTGRDFGASAIHVRHIESGLSCIMMANWDVLPLLPLAHNLMAYALGHSARTPTRTLQARKEDISSNDIKTTGVFLNSFEDVIYVEEYSNNIKLKGFVDSTLSRGEDGFFVNNGSTVRVSIDRDGSGCTLWYETQIERFEFKSNTALPRRPSFASGTYLANSTMSVLNLAFSNGIVELTLPKNRLLRSVYCDDRIAIFDNLWCLFDFEERNKFSLNSSRSKRVEYVLM